MSDNALARIDVANQALQFFASNTQLRLARGYVVVSWTHYDGESVSRRWMTRGQDFYPVWHRQWCYGGTATNALAQLVRWCQGKPVWPISVWKYWCGESVNLTRGRGEELIKVLLAGGYPEQIRCVLCGRVPEKMDWWSLHKVSGPCCYNPEGCR